MVPVGCLVCIFALRKVVSGPCCGSRSTQTTASAGPKPSSPCAIQKLAMASESSPAPAQPSAKFDLTHKLSPYLDLHLMFPTLQFLMENNMYNGADLQRAQLKLAKLRRGAA